MIKSGSALLVLVLITAILLTSLSLLWRGASLAYEGALLNYKQRQQFYACESLAIYGLKLIKAKLVLLEQLKPGHKQPIYQGYWPKQASTWGVLTVTKDGEQKHFLLQAQLFGAQHLSPLSKTNIRCQLEQTRPINQESELELSILDWQNS